MSRLDDLRTMRDFLDREIADEVSRLHLGTRKDPAVLHAATLYGVSVDEILLGVRRHDVTRARHAATWLLHERGLSLAHIGRLFGESPATAWKAVRRVETDQSMRSLLRANFPQAAVEILRPGSDSVQHVLPLTHTTERTA